jgi:Uma2 family endonuclease
MEDAYFTMMLEMPLVPFVMQPVRPLTDEQLERFSAQQDVLHVEREPTGELDVRLIGGTTASLVGTDVMFALYDWNEASGGGLVLPNVGYFLADGSMRGPRISWVPQAQYADFEVRRKDGFIYGAPPFVAEVVSFQRTRGEWRSRMEMWIGNGVELAWLVDPQRKVVEVYRAGQEKPDVLEGVTSVYGEGPVCGFVLELGKVWG